MREYVRNKKAARDFSILETLEAGIVLAGFEVKAIRRGSAKLEGARVVVRGKEAWLVGAAIHRYQAANTPPNYDPERPRKLLLNKRELERLADAERTKGLTAIPLSLYDKHGYIKVAVAIARGKKKADKREDIRRRVMERDAERAFKRSVRF
ncbi:MAG: SsrA-binding protein [Candidatus Parcubacteria bacterium]|nr:MAG: SsrA-binding protein [Candidatus Parcubacteria bacterium]